MMTQKGGVTKKDFNTLIGNGLFRDMSVHVIVTNSQFILLSNKQCGANETYKTIVSRMLQYGVNNRIKHNMFDTKIFNLVQDTLARMKDAGVVESTNPYTYHIYVGNFASLS